MRNKISLPPDHLSSYTPSYNDIAHMSCPLHTSWFSIWIFLLYTHSPVSNYTSCLPFFGWNHSAYVLSAQQSTQLHPYCTARAPQNTLLCICQLNTHYLAINSVDYWSIGTRCPQSLHLKRPTRDKVMRDNILEIHKLSSLTSKSAFCYKEQEVNLSFTTTLHASWSTLAKKYGYVIACHHIIRRYLAALYSYPLGINVQ